MNMPVLLSYIGAFLILLAFALVSNKKLEPTESKYQLLNGFGAGFLAYSAFTTKSWAFVILNSVWALVAIFALTRNIENR